VTSYTAEVKKKRKLSTCEDEDEEATIAQTDISMGDNKPVAGDKRRKTKGRGGKGSASPVNDEQQQTLFQTMASSAGSSNNQADRSEDSVSSVFFCFFCLLPMYVCMYVCMYVVTGCVFYPDATFTVLLRSNGVSLDGDAQCVLAALEDYKSNNLAR
jgi:hypothetical protein